MIAPVQCEYLALEGLTQLLHTLSRVRQALNPRLANLYLLMTMYDARTGLSQDVVRDVRATTRASSWRPSPARCAWARPPPTGSPSCATTRPVGGAAYRALAAEVDGRIFQGVSSAGGPGSAQRGLGRGLDALIGRQPETPDRPRSAPIPGPRRPPSLRYCPGPGRGAAGGGAGADRAQPPPAPAPDGRGPSWGSWPIPSASTALQPWW